MLLKTQAGYCKERATANGVQLGGRRLQFSFAPSATPAANAVGAGAPRNPAPMFNNAQTAPNPSIDVAAYAAYVQEKRKAIWPPPFEVGAHWLLCVRVYARICVADPKLCATLRIRLRNTFSTKILVCTMKPSLAFTTIPKLACTTTGIELAITNGTASNLPKLQRLL